MAYTLEEIEAEARREYERTRDAVIRAAESGYFLPYNNIHCDEHLERAYHEGYRDGMARDVAAGAQ